MLSRESLIAETGKQKYKTVPQKIYTMEVTINGGSYTQTLDFYSSNATVNGGTFTYRPDYEYSEDPLGYMPAF